MEVRLLLGAGQLCHSVAAALADRPGELTVVTDDEHRVDTLRGEGFVVIDRDPTDPGSLRPLETTPETVVVADADPATNLAASRAARTCFPDAFLLAYPGRGAPEGTAADLEAVADTVVHPEESTADRVLSHAGGHGAPARRLQRVLRSIPEHLAIVTHDNPDPDAIASAVALARLAARAGCDPAVYYYGSITHQENRAFVNALAFDIVNMEAGRMPAPVEGVALVDHSRPGVNDGLERDTPVDVVIDHHPPREPIEARFVDLRSEVGATSTLLVEYLERLGVTPGQSLATGLLFGITVDTNEFRRGVSRADFDAAATLLPHVDREILAAIESPTMGAHTVETVGRAIENRRREGAVLVSGVGEIADRDALAQAADRLLTLEGVNTTLVFGVVEGTIRVSARARGTEIDLGETVRDAFGQIGSAGGHADMAGAQIDVGAIDTGTDDRPPAAVIEEAVVERFFAAVERGADQLLPDVIGPVGPAPSVDPDERD